MPSEIKPACLSFQGQTQVNQDTDNLETAFVHQQQPGNNLASFLLDEEMSLLTLCVCFKTEKVPNTIKSQRNEHDRLCCKVFLKDGKHIEYESVWLYQEVSFSKQQRERLQGQWHC